MPKVDLGKVNGEQGPEGPVAQGTMMEATYDPNGKSQDVFAYADEAKKEAKEYAAPAAHAAQHGASGSDPVTPEAIGAIPSTEKGVAGGVAELGEDGKVPSGQLPSLDFVAKAGDTMTGDLAISKQAPRIYLNRADGGSLLLECSGNDAYLVSSEDGTVDNYRAIRLRNAVGESDANQALHYISRANGVSTVKKIYHTGSITAGTTDITAGSAALATDAMYLVYE